MGDTNFLLQNGMTGIVLALFALYGGWVADWDWARDAIRAITTQSSVATIVGMLLATPLIGIIVQTILLQLQHIGYGHPSGNRARLMLATELCKRSGISACDEFPDQMFGAAGCANADVCTRAHRPCREWQREWQEGVTLSDLPSDSFFVIPYYYSMPNGLHQWLRRRQDWIRLYHNWSFAALFGILAGIGVGAHLRPQDYSFGWIFVQFMLVSIVTCIAASCMVRTRSKWGSLVFLVLSVILVAIAGLASEIPQWDRLLFGIIALFAFLHSISSMLLHDVTSKLWRSFGCVQELMELPPGTS